MKAHLAEVSTCQELLIRYNGVFNTKAKVCSPTLDISPTEMHVHMPQKTRT